MIGDGNPDEEQFQKKREANQERDVLVVRICTIPCKRVGEEMFHQKHTNRKDSTERLQATQQEATSLRSFERGNSSDTGEKWMWVRWQ
jgi:hypothetical protein